MGHKTRIAAHQGLVERKVILKDNYTSQLEGVLDNYFGKEACHEDFAELFTLINAPLPTHAHQRKNGVVKNQAEV